MYFCPVAILKHFFSPFYSPLLLFFLPPPFHLSFSTKSSWNPLLCIPDILCHVNSLELQMANYIYHTFCFFSSIHPSCLQSLKAFTEFIFLNESELIITFPCWCIGNDKKMSYSFTLILIISKNDLQVSISEGMVYPYLLFIVLSHSSSQNCRIDSQNLKSGFPLQKSCRS